MPEPIYNNVYISPEQFEFYRSVGRSYDGFVTGMGYAYTQKGVAMTSFSTPYTRTRRFNQGCGFYEFVTTQLLDTSPEARMRSLNLREDDLLRLLIDPSSNGMLRVNMGNGRTVILPVKESRVEVKIDSYGGDLMLRVFAANRSTREEYRTECMVRDMPAVFGNGLSASEKQQSLAPRRNPEIPEAEPDIDVLSVLGKINNFAGLYVGYKENTLVKYRSLFDSKPSQWYAKNKQWRSVDRGANQYTGSKKAVLKKANLYKRTGRIFFTASIFFSIREGAIRYRMQGWDGIIKPGIDVAMSTISSFGGPVGLGIGMVYFVFDAFGVFDKPIVRVYNVPERKDPFMIEQDKTYMAPPLFIEKEFRESKFPLREQSVFRQARKDPFQY